MSKFIKDFISKIDIIFVFFIAIFLFTLSSFFVFKPISTSHLDQEGKELPILELSSFNIKELNKNIVFMDINGDALKQFEDREIFSGFNAKKIDERGEIENLIGKSALHKNDNYYFPEGVNYTKSSGIAFFSTRGIYNLTKETFSGSDKFSLSNQSMDTVGIDIFYDKKNDTITAKNIKSVILSKGK